MKKIVSEQERIVEILDNIKMYVDPHLDVVDLVVVLYTIAPDARVACANGNFA